MERAQQIVSEHFGTITALGMLRLREHQLFREELSLQDFSEMLNAIFGLFDVQ